VSSAQYLYKRFLLPSGKMIEVRKVQDGTRPECVVREVNTDDQLSQGEYNLRLDFLLQRAKAVRHV
jgi:hypothetical protein